ncbi:MAG: cytochrome c [Deltaproteobacteria bacterium]|nr:MAG: cytochrome c [Deltaproteobacteria bacterium]
MRPLWLVLAGLLLAACSSGSVDYPARPVPADLDSEARVRIGKDLFAARCASCHGHPSEGRSPRAVFFEPPAPTFGEPKYRGIDPAYLYWRIEHGKTVEPFLSRGSVMPAWGPHFTSEQIWSLVACLRSRADGRP